ncbi:hypothetical protein BOTBODRAFT_559211 [Botryobasidium botryosum FD-172 SS1]|uniref:Uncharacterized protein n=1 Tax=Botryobasidium botryosum (strain FD-172 SS1) TaxID=930990 RepID=A0A067LZG6_BOTB1|nr:hypothetical protein BOTBODRAFT_559211 [Botryobasidium botryosum FD-172 SS1]
MAATPASSPAPSPTSTAQEPPSTAPPPLSVNMYLETNLVPARAVTPPVSALDLPELAAHAPTTPTLLSNAMTMTNQANIVVPNLINRLPDELLALIFEFTVFSSDYRSAKPAKAILGLSAVSALWRSLTLAHSRLWATPTKLPPSLTELFLARSRAAPLHFAINWNRLAIPESTELYVLLHSQRNRWMSVSVGIDATTPREIFQLLQTGPAPNLRSLTLHRAYTDGVIPGAAARDFFENDAPLLREIRLCGVAMPLCGKIFEPIKKLALDRIQFYGTDPVRTFLRLIARLPCLQSLSLSSVDFISSPDDFEFGRPSAEWTSTKFSASFACLTITGVNPTTIKAILALAAVNSHTVIDISVKYLDLSEKMLGDLLPDSRIELVGMSNLGRTTHLLVYGGVESNTRDSRDNMFKVKGWSKDGLPTLVITVAPESSWKPFATPEVHGIIASLVPTARLAMHLSTITMDRFTFSSSTNDYLAGSISRLGSLQEIILHRCRDKEGREDWLREFAKACPTFRHLWICCFEDDVPPETTGRLRKGLGPEEVRTTRCARRR